VVDDPSGTPLDRKATFTQVLTFIQANTASTDLTDTADIAYLNTANTYSASVDQDFGTSDIINTGQVAIGQAAVTSGKQVAITIPDDIFDEGLTVKNNDGSVSLTNSTGVSTQFQPAIIGVSSGSARYTLLAQARVPVVDDTGSTELMRFDARQDDDTAVTTRPLMAITNASTIEWVMSASGDVDMKANNLTTTGKLTTGDIETATVSANDGTLAITIADTSGDITTTGHMTFALGHDINLQPTDRLYLDGGTHTYMDQESGDKFRIVVGGQQCLTIQEVGTECNVVPGPANAIANDAVDGFLYMPETLTGAPTATPRAYTGKAPFCFDPANKKLYIYNTDASAWESVTLA